MSCRHRAYQTHQCRHIWSVRQGDAFVMWCNRVTGECRDNAYHGNSHNTLRSSSELANAAKRRHKRVLFLSSVVNQWATFVVYAQTCMHVRTHARPVASGGSGGVRPNPPFRDPPSKKYEPSSDLNLSNNISDIVFQVCPLMYISVVRYLLRFST